MLLAGIILGLVAGLAAGGRLDNLLAIRLRWPLLIFVALALRLGTEAALLRDVALGDQLRVPLLATAYGALVVALWVNRTRPGIGLALVGTVLNATAILVNGGYMPVWDQALAAAGMTAADVLSPIHFVLSAVPLGEFLRHAGPLGDVIPVPLPLVRNVLSIGDVLLATGLAFFVFAGLQRAPRGGVVELPVGGAAEPRVDGRVAAATAPGTRHRVRPATGLAASLTESIGLERPVVFGGSGAGVAVPAPTSTPEAPGGLVEARHGLLARALGHPYVRLAQNGSFGALWVGQLVSLFGDRVHQIALAFLVLGVTQSAVAVALTFVAATLPNLVLGPVAGALVDRWDQKRVMVASDLLRAAIVLVHAGRGRCERAARLPAGLRPDVDLDLLPAGADGSHPADRPRGRARGRQLGDLARRFDRRRHRVPAGHAVRDARRELARHRVLARRRLVPRLGAAHRHDDGPGRRPRRGGGRAGYPRPLSSTSSRAGDSFAVRRSSSPTPSRRSPGSSRSASRSG